MMKNTVTATQDQLIFLTHCLLHLTCRSMPDSSPETPLPNIIQTPSSKKAKLVCQLFFSSLEGDFSWPVASFPLTKINYQILSTLVWQVCEAIGSLNFDDGKIIEVRYGVSDGSTYSHSFFSRAGAQNWVTYNPFNDNKPICWLSDYPL